MTEWETSVTHIHRSIALTALHHAAIILFAPEGSHGPRARPARTANDVYIGVLGELRPKTFCNIGLIEMC